MKAENAQLHVMANNGEILPGSIGIGDIVSRISDDEHEVIGVNDVGDMIHVRCIKPDSGGCFTVGETEWNLVRRYEIVRVRHGAVVTVEVTQPCDLSALFADFAADEFADRIVDGERFELNGQPVDPTRVTGPNMAGV